MALDLETHLDRVDELKLFPAAARRIMDLSHRPNAQLVDLEAAVATDPVLTARMLQAANSPFYGVAHRVATVRRAVNLLGVEGTRGVAFALAVSAMAARGGPQARKLYDHALATAAVVREFGPYLPGINPGMMFATALVHDLGLQLLLILEPVASRQLLENHGHNANLARAERATFGFDHAQLGAAGLRRWGLPEEQAVLVETHHEPMGRQQRSRALLQFADAIAVGVTAGEDPADLAERARAHPLSSLLSAPPRAFDTASQAVPATWNALVAA